MSRIAACGVALLLCSCFGVCLAGVVLTPERNSRAIAIENEFISLILDPDRGGAIVSFIHKPSNRDIIKRDSKYMGLFMDHLWGQNWPGELLEVPYEVQILRSEPEEATVRVWRSVTGVWQGVEQRIIQGLIIEKTFTVRRGIDAVFCHVTVRNPQSAGRLPAYWLQNVFFAGGDYDATNDVFYRPSARGVRASWQGSRTEDFVRDPTAGWSAAVDKPKGQGIVFLMDYHDLDMLYNCGGNQTLEWMYDKIPVPAGRSWETDVVLIPTEGIRSFAHASSAFIAGLEITRSGNAVVLTHQLRATFDTVSDLKIAASVIGALDRKEARAPTLTVTELTKELQTFSQSIEVASPDPLAALVTATGRCGKLDFSEHYFVFYAGGYGYGDNVQQDMSTPVFKVDRPEKKQQLMRPETLARTREASPRAFLIKGLHAERYRIEEVLSAMGVTVGLGAFSVGQEGPRTTDFPFDYDALMSHDVIIVANANLQCLGKLGLLMVRDYLTHGGNMLLLGGKAAYGAGGVTGSGIDDLIPVVVEGTRFDIEHIRNARLSLCGKHPIVAGMRPGKQATVCSYLHRAQPRPGANVVITAGGRPFLVVWEQSGGGRIACVLGAPYGTDTMKPPPFFAWDSWPALLRSVLQWLMGRSG